MLPIIQCGFLHIPAYSLMVLIGAISYVVVTILILEKIEKTSQKVTNRLLVISIFGFIFLVAFAFIFNSIFHSIKEGKLVLGGITWLGGVIGAFPLMLLLIHKFCPTVKGEALKYFNFMIPGIVLAHGFGRIGCFLGGCCYGVVTNSIFGVSFPVGSMAALQYPAAGGGSLPVLPTQLFEAVFDFALFFIMILIYKKAKEHFFEIYAFSYGMFRFVLEFFRGDDRGNTGILFFSPSQIMSFILIVYGVLILLYHKKIIFKKIHEKMEDYIKHQADFCVSEGNEKILQTIKELKKMSEEGVITVEEFEERKSELLKRL